MIVSVINLLKLISGYLRMDLWRRGPNDKIFERLIEFLIEMFI